MNFAPLLLLAQATTIALPICVVFGKAATDAAASFIAILFVIHSITNKDFAWLKTPWVRIALTFWLYIILRSFFVQNFDDAMARSASWLRFPLFTVALYYWVLKDKDTANRLLASLMICVGIMVFDTLWQYVTGVSILGNEKFSSDRLTGPFNSPRIGYTLTWIMFPVLIFLLRQPRLPKKYKPYYIHARIASLAAAATLVVTILLTGERAPFLLTLLGLLLAGFLLKYYRKRMVLYAVLGVALISGMVFSDRTVYERQIVSTTYVLTHLWETPYGRIWLDARDAIIANPVFGVGVKQYRTLCNSDEIDTRECQLHPHNIYLELFSETGLVGFAMMISVFFYWVRGYIASWRVWRDDYLITGTVIAVLIRLWPIVATPAFFASWNALPLWLMVGWSYALIRDKGRITSTGSYARKSSHRTAAPRRSNTNRRG